MAVRGEEVAGSIDAHVRESVERMVDEIRSSIEDVRIAVDQQLKAALQSVQADVNSINFLPHIQRTIGELQESIEDERPVAAPAPVAASVSTLKEAAQAIESQKSQVDVLNALLEQCLHFGSCAALLILRNEVTFSGWKGAGFSAHGGNDEAVKRFNATSGLIPELDAMLQGEHVVQWDGVNLATRLGINGSERAVLVPMVIKDKIAAAVFVDAVGEDTSKLDAASVELLVFITGLLVDTLAIRKKSPSPSLTDTPAASPPPPPPPTPTPTPKPEPAVPTRTDAGTVAINAADLRAMMASQRPNFNVPSAEEFSGGGPAATAKVPAVEMKAVPPPPPPPSAAAPPAAPTAAPPAADERPSTQYVPPPNLSRTNAGGPQSEDAKKHDEARRFARLLVSEIKLYNEAKVEQGRRNKDLYERLKDDIDRSRQMYDERIGDDVRKVSNYFYDELVRILADGRAESLGL
jgi:hypothetical protein